MLKHLKPINCPSANWFFFFFLTDLCVGWGARLMFSQVSHLLWLLLSTQFFWLCSTYAYRLPVIQGYMKILSHLFYGSLTLKIFPLSLWLIHLLLQLVPKLRLVELSVSHLFPTDSAACCRFFSYAWNWVHFLWQQSCWYAGQPPTGNTVIITDQGGVGEGGVF